MAAAIVAVEVVGLAVVGDEEVELAVVVEVGPDGGEAEEVVGVVDAGGFGDVGEGAVAVVVIEGVGRAFEAAGAALHGDVVVLAGDLRAELREVVQVEVDVVGDEEIGVAVGVVVAEDGAGGPAFVVVEAGGFGDVGEGAVAVVAIEDDAAEAADEEVGEAVVVEVADGCAHRPAGIADAGFVGDVGEGAVVVVVVEGAAGFLAGERHGDAGGVGEVDVGLAIAVVVDEGYAAAHGFDDVFLVGAGEVLEV